MHSGERLDYEKYGIRYIVILDFGGYCGKYRFDFFNCYSEAIEFVNTAVRRFNSSQNDNQELIVKIEACKEEKEETE